MSSIFYEKKTDYLYLTLSPLILLRLYTLPYWSNPPFFIFDIWALWRSGLSARAPECQKLKIHLQASVRADYQQIGLTVCQM